MAKYPIKGVSKISYGATSKFQELVYSESIDVMFVTETWLNSNISDREILLIGYDFYRTDRSLGRSGGGVLIAIKQDTFINCSQI